MGLHLELFNVIYFEYHYTVIFMLVGFLYILRL